MQKGLFSGDLYQPLAEKLRPTDLGDIVGQDHLTTSGAPLKNMLDKGKLVSMILWGGPGCGKTTLARILAEKSDMLFEPLSAIFSGVGDLRKIFDKAIRARQMGQRTCLFVDEIHRFNKAQQDSFLPYVEDGTITLIGATTENPSFELNAALLSRCRVFVLNRLDGEACEKLLKRAEKIEDCPLPLDEDARASLVNLCDGDGRYLLNMVEALYDEGVVKKLTPAELTKIVQRRLPVYDKGQDSHYNLISALHKSLRGSDCDAALYWLARMLSGGEDPHYILRRLFRFAYEDIGLSDPNAPIQAKVAWDYYERLGSPEGEIALAHLVIYLASAPKSNAAYKAFKDSMRSAKEHGSHAPPKHILNAPTGLMKELGYGEGYEYDHDSKDGFSGQNYFPEKMGRQKYYHPNERGFEREILKRLAYWDKLRGSR